MHARLCLRCRSIIGPEGEHLRTEVPSIERHVGLEAKHVVYPTNPPLTNAEELRRQSASEPGVQWGTNEYYIPSKSGREFEDIWLFAIDLSTWIQKKSLRDAVCIERVVPAAATGCTANACSSSRESACDTCGNPMTMHHMEVLTSMPPVFEPKDIPG